MIIKNYNKSKKQLFAEYRYGYKYRFLLIILILINLTSVKLLADMTCHTISTYQLNIIFKIADKVTVA